MKWGDFELIECHTLRFWQSIILDSCSLKIKDKLFATIDLYHGNFDEIGARSSWDAEF